MDPDRQVEGVEQVPLCAGRALLIRPGEDVVPLLLLHLVADDCQKGSQQQAGPALADFVMDLFAKLLQRLEAICTLSRIRRFVFCEGPELLHDDIGNCILDAVADFERRRTRRLHDMEQEGDGPQVALLAKSVADLLQMAAGDRVAAAAEVHMESSTLLSIFGELAKAVENRAGALDIGVHQVRRASGPSTSLT